MSRVHNQDELTMMVTATVIVATGNGVFNSKHLLVQCSGKQLRKARDNVHEHMNNSARMEWKIKTVGQNGGKALIEGMKIRRFLFICTHLWMITLQNWESQAEQQLNGPLAAN